MDALEFIKNYQSYLEEIEMVVKPKYQPIISKMKSIDAHDIVQPETWFESVSAAKGYVWAMFLRRVKLSNTPNSKK
jgi:hypothetical protein